MSDSDYITPAEVRPGMHVEIVQRPWRGVITAPLVQGTFTADRDDDPSADWVGTSWSVDAVGSIRLIPEPLPTEPGERWRGKVANGMGHWWFTLETPEFVGREGLSYASESGLLWTEEMARDKGLVRLPDPEATP